MNSAQRNVSGQLACPNCGGTQFDLGRTNKAKVASLGLLAALPLVPKRLKCLTCGTALKSGHAAPAKPSLATRLDAMTERDRATLERSKVRTAERNARWQEKLAASKIERQAAAERWAARAQAIRDKNKAQKEARAAKKAGAQ